MKSSIQLLPGVDGTHWVKISSEASSTLDTATVDTTEWFGAAVQLQAAASLQASVSHIWKLTWW